MLSQLLRRDALTNALKSSRLRLLYGDSLQLGKNFRYRKGFSIYLSRRNNARLVIGDNVFFNEDCTINCYHHIEIGKGTIFGENVRMYDHDHAFNHEGVCDGFTSAPIVIGENCWIGTGCIILKGVTIGSGSIIAAGTTVTKSVPPHSMVRDRIDLVVTEL